MSAGLDGILSSDERPSHACRLEETQLRRASCWEPVKASLAACQAILFMQPLMQPASLPINLSVPARCLLSHARLALHIHARPSGTSRPGWDGGPKRNESTVIETRTTPPAPTDSGAIRVKGPPPLVFFPPPWASTCRCSSRTPLYPCDGAPLWQRIEDGVQAPRRTGSSLETRQPYRPAVVLLFPVRAAQWLLNDYLGAKH